MGREVHRGDHPAGTLSYRDGERAQSLLQLLVDHGPPLGADPVQLGAERDGSGDGPGREGAQLGAFQIGVEPVRGSQASSTRPIEVQWAGKRVPMLIVTRMILLVATRET
nr:hypothetical protein GCM10020093_054700 [Planobispora longispora]